MSGLQACCSPGSVAPINALDVKVRDIHRCRELVVQVFYKATELLDDQILMTGFAAGGLSQVPESFFRTASLSAPLAQEQGIFGIKPEVLPRARLMLPASSTSAHYCVLL